MTGSNPFFIHTLWRTSSTWWWAQFRNNSAYKAFYEPLHENLLYRTHEQCVLSHTSKPKAKIFRHPETKDHYFNEYPLRNEGGAEFFEKRFTLDDFVLTEINNDTGLARYIQSLIDHAKKEGKFAAFKFSRSALRGAWIKANFGGTHAYLLREPTALFESSLSFSEYPVPGGPGNYFLACPVMIIAQNSHRPLFEPLAKYLGLKPYHGATFKEEIDHFGQKTNEFDVQTHRDISLFLWILGLAHATHYADLFIDADLARDSSYRRKLARIVEKQTGQSFKVSDGYHLPFSKGRLVVSPSVRRIIAEASNMLAPDWSRVRNGEISLLSLDALEKVIPGISTRQKIVDISPRVT